MITIAPIITWQITDIEKVILKNEGAEEVLAEVTQIEVSRAVQSSTWEQIASYEFTKKLGTTIKRRVGSLGVGVIDFGLSDLTKGCKAIRLFHN